MPCSKVYAHWVSHLPCSHDLSHPKYMTEMSISVPAKYAWAILVSFTSQIVARIRMHPYMQERRAPQTCKLHSS